MRRRYVVLVVLAVLAVLAGAVGPSTVQALGGGSYRDRLAADPAPPLLPDSSVAATGTQIDAQDPVATRLLAGWWSAHGTGRHDAAFARWLETTLPGPPSTAQRSAELRQVQALARTRTPAGVTASTWLETHGKKDIWKLYLHDQDETVAAPVGAARKTELKAALAMGKTVADALGARYRQPAPYVLDPALRPDHHVVAGQVCPCSYPSRHATEGAAARTLLRAFDPHRDGEYRWMQDEVAWSRVYMAGHVPSDIRGGALLGDLIGHYFLVSRGQQQPS